MTPVSVGWKVHNLEGPASNPPNPENLLENLETKYSEASPQPHHVRHLPNESQRRRPLCPRLRRIFNLRVLLKFVKLAFVKTYLGRGAKLPAYLFNELFEFLVVRGTLPAIGEPAHDLEVTGLIIIVRVYSIQRTTKV